MELACYTVLDEGEFIFSKKTDGEETEEEKTD